MCGKALGKALTRTGAALGSASSGPLMVHSHLMLSQCEMKI